MQHLCFIARGNLGRQPPVRRRHLGLDDLAGLLVAPNLNPALVPEPAELFLSEAAALSERLRILPVHHCNFHRRSVACITDVSSYHHLEHLAQGVLADLQVRHHMVEVGMPEQGLHGLQRLTGCKQARGEGTPTAMAGRQR